LTESEPSPRVTEPPKAVIFDLDDTLTDRSLDVASYSEVFFADFRDDLDCSSSAGLLEAIRRCDRNGYNPDRPRDLAAKLPWRIAPTPEALHEHWMAVFPGCTRPREGARELIWTLRERGIALGVLTNGSVAGQSRKLDQMKLLDSFDAVVISEGVGLAKPDPQIFVLMLRELGLAAGECWFVGDNPRNDVVGASDAGMHAIWLRSSTPWPDGVPRPEREIRHLRELLDPL
jgi:putative hydrolase of the HAD superfamily